MVVKSRFELWAGRPVLPIESECIVNHKMHDHLSKTELYWSAGGLCPHLSSVVFCFNIPLDGVCVGVFFLSAWMAGCASSLLMTGS
jgi:hypothetical protein